MAQTSTSNPNLLPGIVTDQPEIFESEPVPSDDTGVNDLDLLAEPADDAIALIEVPTKQAFSYFAERENEIAKFYVQRYGEYKISSDKPDDETDIEKYHRLMSEVNDLLNKFQTDQAAKSERKGFSLTNTALTHNLDILSKQLKSLEFAAKDGSLNPSQAGFIDVKSKINNLITKMYDQDENEDQHAGLRTSDETSKQIRMNALEKRLKLLESIIGYDDEKTQSILQATRSDTLTEATNKLSSWSELFKPEGVQRVNKEIDFLVERLDKIEEQTNEQEKQLGSQTKTKLDKLYEVVCASDKYRAIVPNIIHRLIALEELQQKAAQVTTTVNQLEQIQGQISDSLQANRDELTSLTDMFAKNIELIKEFSKDIDTRILHIKNRDN